MKTEFTVLHLYSGSGGGALGFKAAKREFRGVMGSFRTLGGIDMNADACKDFRKLTGVRAKQAHIEKIGPAHVRSVCKGETPDVVFLSPPCKGFSGLLSNKKAKTEKYQALNELVPQGLFLIMETFKKSPPPLVLIENVPRIATRGRTLLNRTKKLLRNYGYVFNEGTHDCGELGGLGQHRKRFLLIARLPSKIPNFVYQPRTKRVRAIGEILSSLPMPNDKAGGPMHTLPKLEWRTWVRLALIPAGGDWRDLPGNEGKPDYSIYGVVPWDQTGPTITGKAAPGAGPFSVADPRVKSAYRNTYGVVPWDEPLGTVTGRGMPSTGAYTVADPRPRGKRFNNIYRVVKWENPSVAVTGGGTPTSGGVCVADPRLGCSPRSGTYGVVPWDQPSKTVTASADIHAGTSAVADPRLPGDHTRPDVPPVIVSLDGTWHRPLTTYELAALQGFPLHVDGKPLKLAGNAHTKWRERIGNAVPPPAARAMAETVLTSLLAASMDAELTSFDEVWVVPVNQMLEII